eukprot:scaffold125655_cov33-Tisochrysis_lutea.AAC.4
MLKKRFGDSALAVRSTHPDRPYSAYACEVMLTDVAESRRVSRAIRSHLGAAAAQSAGDDASAPIDATIVSRLSWPHLSQKYRCRIACLLLSARQYIRGIARTVARAGNLEGRLTR